MIYEHIELFVLGYDGEFLPCVGMREPMLTKGTAANTLETSNRQELALVQGAHLWSLGIQAPLFGPVMG